MVSISDRCFFRILSLLCLVLLVPLSSHSKDESIDPEQALAYLGQKKTVCGKVASSIYASTKNGSPTFLNLNKPYPNHIFIVVIWGRNRYKFNNAPETFYKSNIICVTGVIDTYKGIPEIEVTDPSQIKLSQKETTSSKSSNDPYYNRYTSNEIKLLKTILFILGYDVDYRSTNWTNKATNAVKAFQKKNFITQDGQIGPITLRKIA